jgi:hypothetical protein
MSGAAVIGSGRHSYAARGSRPRGDRSVRARRSLPLPGGRRRGLRGTQEQYRCVPALPSTRSQRAGRRYSPRLPQKGRGLRTCPWATGSQAIAANAMSRERPAVPGPRDTARAAAAALPVAAAGAPGPARCVRLAGPVRRPFLDPTAPTSFHARTSSGGSPCRGWRNQRAPARMTWSRLLLGCAGVRPAAAMSSSGQQ